MSWSAILDELAGGQTLRPALSDPLTGLPNRVLFADRLDQALARAARSGTRGRKAPRLLVMLIDLNGFRADAVLVEVARRLNEQLRGADTVARLAVDHFALVCEDVRSSDGGASLARRFAAALAEPYLVDGEEAHVSAAIGIAIAAPLHEDAGALLRRADAAMYAAKRDGAGRVALAAAP